MKPGLVIKEMECPDCKGYGLIDILIEDPVYGDMFMSEMCDNCKGEGIIEIEVEAWEEKYNNKD